MDVITYLCSDAPILVNLCQQREVWDGGNNPKGGDDDLEGQVMTSRSLTSTVLSASSWLMKLSWPVKTKSECMKSDVNESKGKSKKDVTPVR